ncbi:MAG: tyrosine--tRNA ligase, partial [Candidatus Azambacteria bacterium]|nr:tyrosine--tRNA ligase [Candidatus Azambacteria bacterium]
MKVITDKEKIKTLLTRAVSEVIVKDHLEVELKSGRKLRIKLGIDPTAPDIHFGHAVSLMKLKQFQELGHQAVLIIGDFTAKIGDPTGRLESREALSSQTIKKNLKGYLEQIGKIINIGKTEIRYNNEWFGKMGARGFYDLTARVTVQQVMKRDDFRKRIESDQDITINEMMYPLFQGYDSVMVKADVELGGEDQKVNLLMGRRVQRAYGVPEQDILTTWLIEGTDGGRKMSKSFSNYIGVAEKPDAMFGKIMSIPDALIIKYFEALTIIPDSEINDLKIALESQKMNPRDIKNKLAFEIVKIYHGEKSASKAEEEFNKVFRKHELPEEIPVVLLQRGFYNVVDLLLESNLVKSKNEARRLVNENAVKIGGE